MFRIYVAKAVQNLAVTPELEILDDPESNGAHSQLYPVNTNITVRQRRGEIQSPKKPQFQTKTPRPGANGGRL